MRRPLLIPSVLFVLLFVLMLIGLFGQAPFMVLSYLCFIPFVGIWVGRASMRVQQFGARRNG